jgi:hypothetical protein
LSVVGGASTWSARCDETDLVSRWRKRCCGGRSDLNSIWLCRINQRNNGAVKVGSRHCATPFSESFEGGGCRVAI